MKKTSYLATIAAVFLAAVAFAWIAGAAEDPAKARLALKGQDPIELIAGKTVQGKEELSAVHKKLRYLFATPQNKQKFEADPARYAIQGNGECIVAPDAPADPSIFTVYEGKIYAFATPQCVTRFKEDPRRYTDPRR